MKLKLVLISVLLLGLTSCGFHFPNQTSLNNTISKINIDGAYHTKFYKLVVNKLKARGVEVHYQSSDNRKFTPIEGIPTLTIAAPSISLPIVSVDSKQSALEYNMVIKTSATLNIPNHNRPIVMRNGLTRTTLNKSNNSLASENERYIMQQECFEELSNQLIARLNYLGKQSDPNSPKIVPATLLLAKDEDNNEVYIDTTESLTLIEALQAQDSAAKIKAQSYTLDDLNNGKKILSVDDYKLPSVAPTLQHSAPDLIDESGNIKNHND